MKLGSRLACSLAASLVSLGLAYAADGYYVVTRVEGKAEARPFVERNGHRVEGAWRRLAVGDNVIPRTEIRTGEHSHLWLQPGAEILRRRRKEGVKIKVLAPNTRVRINPDLPHGPKVFEVLDGKVRTRE